LEKLVATTGWSAEGPHDALLVGADAYESDRSPQHSSPKKTAIVVAS
jgi:hypothetical protein